MDQNTIARVFEIEERASKIHEDAQQQAKQMLADAQRAVTQERKRKLKEVQQEAARIVAQSRQTAQEEREKLLAQAEEEARQLEARAQQNLKQAVNFVLGQIAGRK